MTAQKPIPELTNTELLDLYKKGAKWLTDHMQGDTKDVTVLGEPITEESMKVFEKGLHKLEQVETEMEKRGIVYG